MVFEEVSKLKTSLGGRVTRFAEHDSTFSKNHLKIRHVILQKIQLVQSAKNQCQLVQNAKNG